MTATATTTKRPTTCSGMFAVDPTLGEKGCKRLPRHGGDHRTTRTLAEGRKAVAASAKVTKAPKGRTGRKVSIAATAKLVADLRSNAGVTGRKQMTAAQRRSAFGELMALVNDGRITAAAALPVAAKLR